MNRKKETNLIGFAVVIVLIGVALYYFGDFRTGVRQEARESRAGVESAPVLPQGKQTFRIASGETRGPRFIEGFIDPYDPEIGDMQTLNVAVSANEPIATVEATMITDNSVLTYPLSRKSGTLESGEFQGTWRVTDTHLRNYRAKLTATTRSGESKSIEITLR